VFNGSTVGGVIGAALLLILVYLLVVNWAGTASIIGTIGENSVAGIKALQGR
jgi:hypothetical protein